MNNLQPILKNVKNEPMVYADYGNMTSLPTFAIDRKSEIDSIHESYFSQPSSRNHISGANPHYYSASKASSSMNSLKTSSVKSLRNSYNKLIRDTQFENPYKQTIFVEDMVNKPYLKSS